MSYTPTTWEKGDTITAVKLNKIEGACVMANCMVIPATGDPLTGMTLTKTFSEIKTAVESGIMCVVFWDLSDETEFECHFDCVAVVSEGSGLCTVGTMGEITLSCSSEEGYPTNVQDTNT